MHIYIYTSLLTLSCLGAVPIRQLWSEEEPGLAASVSPNRPRQRNGSKYTWTELERSRIFENVRDRAPQSGVTITYNEFELVNENTAPFKLVWA